MLNTYGIRSVNRETFNVRYHDKISYPRQARNAIVTALRIHNGVLNVLGYIPGISTVSGVVRMVTGLAIIGITSSIGDRDAEEGAIIGHWYDEAVQTGTAQITRGAFEALVPFGRAINLTLDIIATPFNFSPEVVGSMVCEGCMGGGENHARPHDDVSYSFPFMLLHLV